MLSKTFDKIAEIVATISAIRTYELYNSQTIDGIYDKPIYLLPAVFFEPQFGVASLSNKLLHVPLTFRLHLYYATDLPSSQMLKDIDVIIEELMYKIAQGSYDEIATPQLRNFDTPPPTHRLRTAVFSSIVPENCMSKPQDAASEELLGYEPKLHISILEYSTNFYVNYKRVKTINTPRPPLTIE